MALEFLEKKLQFNQAEPKILLSSIGNLYNRRYKSLNDHNFSLEYPISVCNLNSQNAFRDLCIECEAILVEFESHIQLFPPQFFYFTKIIRFLKVKSWLVLSLVILQMTFVQNEILLRVSHAILPPEWKHLLPCFSSHFLCFLELSD